MDDEALARVFEPYFSTKATGTGLGLPIARRNVELNGGTIEVDSAKGRGHDGDDRCRLPMASAEAEVAGRRSLRSAVLADAGSPDSRGAHAAPTQADEPDERRRYSVGHHHQREPRMRSRSARAPTAARKSTK